jgi:hypothetical protein
MLVRFFYMPINLRHGTYSFTSPLKEFVLRIFITLENPSSSAGFEPANLGSSGKHVTTRPPRATYAFLKYKIIGETKTNKRWRKKGRGGKPLKLQ